MRAIFESVLSEQGAVVVEFDLRRSGVVVPHRYRAAYLSGGSPLWGIRIRRDESKTFVLRELELVGRLLPNLERFRVPWSAMTKIYCDLSHPNTSGNDAVLQLAV